MLKKNELVRSKRCYRRAQTGCAKSIPQEPNDIWAADYKGKLRLKNGKYCSPLTVSDLSTRYLLGIESHPAILLDESFDFFRALFLDLRASYSRTDG
jgi:putative transposase